MRGCVVSSPAMRTSALDYDLPADLIAQYPSEKRDASRLLIVDRSRDSIREDVFRNFPSYLGTNDCVVVNDSRVVRARLKGRKSSGGAVEIFLLREVSRGRWEALVRPSGRLKPGSRVELGDRVTVTATVEELLENGNRVVRFDDADVLEIMERTGETPLPPYIRRESPDARDAERYQTIYARAPGAVAAPTAGLHFTDSVLGSLREKGVPVVGLTLHVGYGTFKPVQSDELGEHRVDAEDYLFPKSTADSLNTARAQGGRVVAVGTTSVRTLETRCVDGRFSPGEGKTDVYIYPPYSFGGAEVLLTNFHLPRSSLLALVCAFGGTDLVLEAYRHAVAEKFRFYSYGDAMLIL